MNIPTMENAMSENVQERRTFLSQAAGITAVAAAAGLSGIATVEAAGVDKVPTTRRAPVQAGHASKSIVEIPAGNPVYGKSVSGFDEWAYAAAVRANGFLFIAGAVGFRADGTIPESVGEQCELAFKRLEEILRLEGLTMADLVEVVSYHVELKANLDAFMPVKARHFVRPFPAWTLIGVEALGLPELKVEIRATAAYPAPAG
ncbi:hypothetical protein KPL74_08700 [Bacillus sp. NP157]|nr:hypothetical protein KPL74_08700 [Bacillus sp. NP157]